MSVRRVMGIETEYGISLAGAPNANPMVLSGQVVTAYAQATGVRAARASWDYADEAPLRDARGFDMGRSVAHPSQLTDEDDPTLANVVLTNGARLYVDHAHPEYSSPEVTGPRDALIWDRAGELVMREAVARLAASPPGINLYKNNTDGKGASYGTHENYLMRRSTPFAQIVTHLTPFFVARQVMCGSGRVGLGTDSTRPGYQISQRSDFFEVEVGLETTLKRPIINTRDEPHAVADKYRRLHVIIGDANHCDVAGLLKLGTTSLVLGMIEAGAITQRLTIRNPVATLQAISHDPSLTELLELEDGRRLTAVQLLWIYYEMAQAWLQATQTGQEKDTAEVMHWWEHVLSALERDPLSAAGEVDWVAKLAVLQAYRDRDQMEWNDPRLKAIDIQWSDVRPEKGIFNKLRAAGRCTELVSEQQVREAVTSPPGDTRAYFRGRVLDHFPEDVVAASWDSVILQVPGVRHLHRVPMMEPLKGTAEDVRALFDEASDVGDFLDRLRSEAGT